MTTTRWLVCAAMLSFLVPSLSAAQPAPQPTCEDQLAVNNQVLQDTEQQRWRLQVETGSQKVQIERLKKEVETVKATIKASEPKK